MSRYTKPIEDNKLASWGLDKPTGGYFFSVEKGDEVLVNVDGLMFSGLKPMLENIGVTDASPLVEDWEKEPPPTALQQVVFNVFKQGNLLFTLKNVEEDLKNFKE